MKNQDKNIQRMVNMVRAFGAISVAGIGVNSYMVLSGFMSIV